MVSVIESFVAAYKRQIDFYLEAARLCKLQCESLLKENGIRAMVTYRAKGLDRLLEKLTNRNSHKQYKSHDSIRKDIVDLAGVRAALYFPGDREQFDKLIPSSFVLLEKPKKFPTPKTASSKQKFSGYHATHYRIKMRSDYLPGEQTRYAEAPIELQVASVLMHAWAEVEHDLVYKPAAGDLSADEYAILDQLNGLVLSGETALELLQRAVKARVASGGTPFANQYELAAFLFEELRKSQPAMARAQEPIMGRVDLLLGLIRHAGLDSPDALKPYVGTLSADTEKRPIADQVVDRILAERNDLYERFLDLQNGDRAESEVSPISLDEKYQLVRKFLAKWIVLFRFFQKLAPELGIDPLSVLSAIEGVSRNVGLSDEVIKRIRNVRMLRDRLVHGKGPADTTALRDGIEELDSIFKVLDENPQLNIKEAMRLARSGA